MVFHMYNKIFTIQIHVIIFNRKTNKTKYNYKLWNLVYEGLERLIRYQGKTLRSLRHAYVLRRWAITVDIEMVAQEIGDRSYW